KFSSKSGDTIRYYKPLTLLKGIQTGATFSKPHIGWLIGNGQKIDLWRDTWATDIQLMEYIDMPRRLRKKCKARLNDFINLRGWHFPNDLLLLLLILGINIQNIQCNPNSHDTMI
ncbi:hypothetical protein GIB67_041517, partial [Kingdonia uniflora]